MAIKTNHRGNTKLGKKVSVLSRPVGTTCPQDCFFLDNGCYAQNTERRFPKARAAAQTTLSATTQELEDFLREAKRRNNDVRWHERGDFLIDNDLDIVYIRRIVEANLNLIKAGAEPPKQWAYTHVLDSRILLLEPYVSLYLSVDSEQKYEDGKRLGFSLFAFTTPFLKGDGANIRSIDVYDKKVVPVCWEQLGTKDSCETCQYCIKGVGSIAFLQH